MVVAQGEVWWADLGEPAGSAPALRRPAVIVQGDAFNRSRIATVVCVPLTSNLKWADAPGNVLLTQRDTGLPKPSVANVSQIVTVDRATLSERVGKLSRQKIDLVRSGIDTVFGR
jgi:mRNA interferase MazF